ncbi:MAG: hypothetical protein OEZ59_10890 [Deltaproteobacteria bacterium]|nr:hypothetical protein [Deltaproteobacteria bacterium]
MTAMMVPVLMVPVLLVPVLLVPVQIVALLAALLAAAPGSARADALGLETPVITIHLRRETYELGRQYPRRLDREGRVILMPGLEAYYDQRLETPRLGAGHLRYVAGWYRDSMNKPSGYLTAGGHWSWDWGERTRLGFYFGPSLIFRHSWKNIENYDDDRFYKQSRKFMPGYQYKLYVGGKVELRRVFSAAWEGVYSIVPGIPYVMVHYLGVRRQF